MVHRCRREEIKCRVCLDRPVNNVFVPCGHVSCEECGLRLTHCHICRKAIDIRQRCYFPWEEDEEESPPPHSHQDAAMTAATEISPTISQPASSTANTTSTTTPVLSTTSVDKPDGSSLAPATSTSSKPQRSVAFNVQESTESEGELPAEDSSSEEEGTESSEAMHPGAFDFFHRHRRRFKRERENSASTSSAVSTPMDRISPT